ncbi:MAG: hypothetical protein V2I63_03580, partial [Pseudomonadales bacterium]|nr:hypothetical protein [Pseudomonadales bacterium]
LHRFAAGLALTAAVFGGLVLGAGNMLQLYLDPAAAASLHGAHGVETHGEHAGHGAQRPVTAEALSYDCGPHAPEPVPEAAPPAVPTLPAHCLFCLDGIVPQPVVLAIPVADGVATLAPVPPVHRTLDAPIPRADRAHRPRGPPAHLVRA